MFNFFKTKRILEENGYFYPQEWKFINLEWRFKDKKDGYLWSLEESGKKYSKCNTLEEAKAVLTSQKPPSKKYHYV